MGVVDAAISALKISTMAHVHFKALGILRLLVEKQGYLGSICIIEHWGINFPLYSFNLLMCYY